MGFLKKTSLHLIVDAPRNHSISSLFSFKRVGNVQSVPINEPGLLLKLFIAARFNVTVSSGWPVLQIRRRNGDSYNLVREFGQMMEPRPTGYLNVYEYDLKNITFEVQCDDVVRVYWPVDTNPSVRRYSLAYFRNSSNVMLAIEVRQNNNSMCTTNSTLDTTDSEDTAEPISTHTATSIDQMGTPGLDTTELEASETAKNKQSNNIAAIIGGVLCAMAVIVFLVVLAIIVFLAYLHRTHTKKFSPNTDNFSTLTTSGMSVPIFPNPTYSTTNGKFQC